MSKFESAKESDWIYYNFYYDDDNAPSQRFWCHRYFKRLWNRSRDSGSGVIQFLNQDYQANHLHRIMMVYAGFSDYSGGGGDMQILSSPDDKLLVLRVTDKNTMKWKRICPY
jgi:hypothetical protein